MQRTQEECQKLLPAIMAEYFPDPFMPREVLLVATMMMASALRNQPLDKREMLLEHAFDVVRKALSEFPKKN